MRNTALALTLALLAFPPAASATSVAGLPEDLRAATIENELKPANDAEVGTVLVNGCGEALRVRAEADPASRIIFEIKPNETFTALEVKDGVARVAAIDGIGYVNAADLKRCPKSGDPVAPPATPGGTDTTAGTSAPPAAGTNGATSPPPAAPPASTSGTSVDTPTTVSGTSVDTATAAAGTAATPTAGADPVSTTTAAPPASPATPAPTGPTLTITFDKDVYLREGKSPDAFTPIAAPPKAQVMLLSYEGAWCIVEYQGKRGYVRSFYVGLKDDLPAGTFQTTWIPGSKLNGDGAPPYATLGAPTAVSTASPPPSSGPVRILQQSPVELRLDKSMSSSAVVTIPAGATVNLLAIEDNWCKVEYGGKIGYVRSQDLGQPSSIQVSPNPNAIRTSTGATTAPPPATSAPPATTTATGTTTGTTPSTPAPPATPTTPVPPPTTPPTTTATTPPPATADDPTRKAQEEVARLTNEERAKQNLKPLTLDAKMCEVAQKHAEDMKRRNFFNHTNPDGKSPFQRMSEAGISYWGAGENIAMNYSPAGAVSAWMNSAGHRANILNGSFTTIGTGVCEGYYVQVFASK